jgi:hypothetical protein
MADTQPLSDNETSMVCFLDTCGKGILCDITLSLQLGIIIMVIHENGDIRSVLVRPDGPTQVVVALAPCRANLFL